ncbi:MAG: hydrolase TatD, partial [Psychromonas sp.]|nr:hydrolase TatD [Psychromonas sp.]
MIDIGINLTNKRFEKDLPSVIENAKLAGVSGLMVTGTSIEESQQALKLC